MGCSWSGAPAILGFLVTGALCAALAWGVYNRSPAAWWACVVCFLLSCVNGALLFRGGGIRGMYEAMGMPAAQLQQIDRMGILEMCSHPVVRALIVVLWLGVLGFLIWARRFFAGGSERSAG